MLRTQTLSCSFTLTRKTLSYFLLLILHQIPTQQSPHSPPTSPPPPPLPYSTMYLPSPSTTIPAISPLSLPCHQSTTPPPPTAPLQPSPKTPWEKCAANPRRDSSNTISTCVPGTTTLLKPFFSTTRRSETESTLPYTITMSCSISALWMEKEAPIYIKVLRFSN